MYKVIPESLMFEEYGGGGESMYEAAGKLIIIALLNFVQNVKKRR